MKQFLIVVILSISFQTTCFSQWLWSKQLGSGSINYHWDSANSLINDGINHYLIGDYGDMLLLPGDTLISNGINDIFISKFDDSGNLIWAKTLGGNFNQPSAIEIAWAQYDIHCNCIYLSGSFTSTISFGGGISLQAWGATEDIFLARMNLDGIFSWAVRIGSSNADVAQPFVTPDGNILLAGEVLGTAVIGTNTINPGGFLAEFDSTGNCIWAEHKFSGPVNYLKGIKFIGNDIIMAGGYQKLNGYIDTVSLPSTNSMNGYITRMDSVGNVKWLSTFGNNGEDFINSIDIDDQNNIFVGGGIEDSVSVFGVPINNSGKSIIISKLDENGNLIWLRDINCFGGATTIAGSPIGTANEVFRDHNDNLFVTGSFSGAATFGQFNLTASTTSDMFLARYDTSGNALGIKNFGEAIGVKLSMTNSGKITTAGIFYNSIAIGSNSYTSYGFNDIYLAQSDEFVGVSEERLTSNQLLIYANPTAGKCTITVPDEFINEPYLQLNILDNSGKIIQQKTVEMNDGKIKLNLEAEAKGMYHVTLGNGKKKYSGKIVFE